MTQVPTPADKIEQTSIAKASPTPKPFDPTAFADKAQEADPISRVSTRGSVMANNPYVQHMVRSLETKKALEMPVPADQAHVFVSWLRDAAKKNDNGLRVQYIIGNEPPTSDPKAVPEKGSVKVRYQATTKKGGARERTTCPVCGREGVSVTMEGKIRSHKVGGAVCAGTGQSPKAVEAPAPVDPPSSAE